MWFYYARALWRDPRGNEGVACNSATLRRRNAKSALYFARVSADVSIQSVYTLQASSDKTAEQSAVVWADSFLFGDSRELSFRVNFKTSCPRVKNEEELLKYRRYAFSVWIYIFIFIYTYIWCILYQDEYLKTPDDVVLSTNEDPTYPFRESWEMAARMNGSYYSFLRLSIHNCKFINLRRKESRDVGEIIQSR